MTISRPRFAVLLPLLLCATASPAAPPPGPTAAPWFRDVAEERGLRFFHRDGRTGEKLYIETGGSGAGLIDLDGDGDLDAVLLDGAPAPGVSLTPPSQHRWFENRGGRFIDRSRGSGLDRSGHGMGLCAGDIDADGRVDLYIAQYGDDLLLRNRGDGSFEEVARSVGIVDRAWSSSCAFGDLDGDRDLDLLVTHYVDFRFDRNPYCGDRARGLRTYCRPDVFSGLTDSLWIAGPDGRFRDEATARGLAQGASEKGFGAVLSDLDDDGDLDMFVANDGTMNRLYENDGQGRFVDRSLRSGVGFNGKGQAESSMGVALGDVDGDLRPDLLVTNYSMETNTLYRNLGRMLFEDVTPASGIGPSSYKLVGWGTAFFDFDNDGDLDLAVANGHALDNIEQFEPGLAHLQPALLLENVGRGRFRDVSGDAGADWTRPRSARGLAVGDFDDDGRLDLLVSQVNGPAALLRNDHPNRNHWLGVQLVDRGTNPLAIGARLVLAAGAHRQWREVTSGGSFQSQSDLRLHFGLGAHFAPVELTIRWPDGVLERRRLEGVDRYVRIVRGD